MSSSPLVSVIVPSYNHDKYISECINSILNQSYKNIQLIVLDDGSKDSSVTILKKMSVEHGFHFEEQANLGLCKTLNKAIKNYAKGKYISIVASDDYWSLDKITSQVEFLEQNNDYAMVFGKARIVDNDNNFFGVWGEGISELDLQFEGLLLDNKVIASTAMIRKDVLESIGGFNESSYIEDWDLWLKIAIKSKIGFINKIQGFYRRHDTNMSSNLLKMENAKTDIIKQWADHPLYSKAYRKHILLKANVLAVKFKTESLKILWCNKKYILSLGYMKAIVRILFFW